MDITKTRDQLVDRALEKLGVVGSGQSAEAEDQARVDSVVDATLGDLAARRIIYVANEDAIPVEWFEWLADLLADNVAEDFGRVRDATKRLYAESMLRNLVAGMPTYEPLKVEYL